MPDQSSEKANVEVVWHESQVTRQMRWEKFKTKGLSVLFTGLSGSGKSTLAALVEERLVESGINAYLLDGDNLRHGINSGLTFSHKDREENIRRAGEVAKLFADLGVVALLSLVSPFSKDRDQIRLSHSNSDLKFIEVYVSTPIEICEGRDSKRMYKKARRGEIPDFTGISSPYEPPGNPELEVVLDSMEKLEEACQLVVELIEKARDINEL